MRRAFFLICVALLGLAWIAGPAAADSSPRARSTTTYAPNAEPIFDVYPSTGISCPLPYLDTGFGPLSMCTELDGSLGGAGWYGPYSSGLPAWANDLRIVNKLLCVNQNALAVDGVRGTVITSGRLDAGGFGEIRPGVQYIYYGFQAIGRPGNWGSDARFHPTDGWHNAGGDIETSFEGCL
ncbi:hypothetical protein [Flindersiella endophytica]